MGPTCISKIQGRYGSDQMIRLLDEHIGPALVGDHQPPVSFILDQFPVHLCSPVKDWFSRHDGINLAVLPPKSMDLMPVHKIGDLLVDHINRQDVDIQNVDALWNSISKNFSAMSRKGLFNTTLAEISELAKMICENNGN